MSEDSTYNGWKNYPTWAVHLWLDNEQGSQDACLDMARDAMRTVAPRWTLGDILKEEVRESCEGEGSPIGDAGASMASDLLGYALDCVDWYEIADAYLEMIEEEATA